MPYVKNMNDDPVAVKYVRELKVCRVKAELTQAQLAKTVGTCESMIGAYERHEAPVSIKIYNRLADLFRWPHYKQSPNETLSLDFENPKQAEHKQAENPNREYITTEQLANFRAIAGIKGCSVSKLLDKIIAPYADALNALRNL